MDFLQGEADLHGGVGWLKVVRNQRKTWDVSKDSRNCMIDDRGNLQENEWVF